MPSSDKFKRLKNALSSNIATFVIFAIVASAIVIYQQRNLVSGQAPALADIHYSDFTQNQQATLVYFWGSWCGICSITSPAVNNLAKDHNIITVALSSGDEQELQDYLTDNQYQFKTINDDDGIISGQWGVEVTPSLFYINSAGEIVWVSSGLSSEWGMRLKLWLTSYL